MNTDWLRNPENRRKIHEAIAKSDGEPIEVAVDGEQAAFIVPAEWFRAAEAAREKRDS